MKKIESKKTKNEENLFLVTGIPSEAKKQELDIDLNKLYERASSELSLQQSKRDLIINIYLGMFSFLVPFTLSLGGLAWHWKGLIFLAAALIGFLFANIIVRYRVYKECYWFCCETITVLFGVKPEFLKKKVVQQCYFNTIYKKGKKYLIDKKGITKEGKETVSKKFSKTAYIFGNIFSSETIYFFIHSLITSFVFGMGLALLFEFTLFYIMLSSLLAFVLFLLLCTIYFSQCIKAYGVLIDGTHKSFNFAFGKAWFLHFYLDDEESK